MAEHMSDPEMSAGVPVTAESPADPARPMHDRELPVNAIEGDRPPASAAEAPRDEPRESEAAESSAPFGPIDIAPPRLKPPSPALSKTRTAITFRPVLTSEPGTTYLRGTM